MTDFYRPEREELAVAPTPATMQRRIRAIEELLGFQLIRYCTPKLADGQGWDSIAQDIAVVSQGAVKISGRTLSRYYELRKGTPSDD